MRPRTPRRWKKGDPITAPRLNEMLELILRSDVSVPNGGPLRAQNTATGTLLSFDMTGFGFLAVCAADIASGTAMTSGGVGATGSALLGTFYPVTVAPPTSFSSGQSVNFTIPTGTPQILAYNPSSTAQTGGAGIKAGQLCWIQMDNTGLYMAAPLECS